MTRALEFVLIDAVLAWMNAPISDMAFAYGRAQGVARAVAAAYGIPFDAVWNAVLDAITEVVCA